jgi:hypothetical protein
MSDPRAEAKWLLDSFDSEYPAVDDRTSVQRGVLMIDGWPELAASFFAAAPRLLRDSLAREEALASTLTAQEQRANELLEALRVMVRSARPHPIEHPTMYAAWTQAADVIAKSEGR